MSLCWFLSLVDSIAGVVSIVTSMEDNCFVIESLQLHDEPFSMLVTAKRDPSSIKNVSYLLLLNNQIYI